MAHGVVEGQAEDLDVEVNGVAGQIAFGPAPVAVFDDETGVGGQNKIARLAGDEFQLVRQPGGASGSTGDSPVLVGDPPKTLSKIETPVPAAVPSAVVTA